MIDWRQGGPTGSIERWVRREVRTQLQESPAARGARYGLSPRVLRVLLSPASVIRFIGIYLAINLFVAGGEALIAALVPSWIPAWASSSPPGTDVKALILNISSYLIGVQVGLLGALALALALVTLIAQRESASSDVKVYYHESLAFQIVASCIALLVVLCIQLLWPVQFLLHLTGLGTGSQFFKLILLTLHTAWVVVNLAAVGYFISTTFGFVQQSSRERLRERYTANVVQPEDMTLRLRQTLFMAGSSLLDDERQEAEKRERPTVIFTYDLEEPYEVELRTDFRIPAALRNVRMRWVRWALRRWARRCLVALPPPTDQARPLGTRGPVIWFDLRLDARVSGQVSWCRRRGGVPLDWLERFVLARSFIFRRYRDEP